MFLQRLKDNKKYYALQSISVVFLWAGLHHFFSRLCQTKQGDTTSNVSNVNRLQSENYTAKMMIADELFHQVALNKEWLCQVFTKRIKFTLQCGNILQCI